MAIIVNGTVADATKAFQAVFDQLEAIGLEAMNLEHLSTTQSHVHFEKMIGDMGLSRFELAFTIKNELFTANISPEFLSASSVDVGDTLLANVSFDEEEQTYVINQATNLSKPTFTAQPRG